MRLFTISILLLLAATLTFGQDSTGTKKFYIEVGGGYCFPFVNDELQSPREEVGTLDYLLRPDSSLSVKPVQSTLGQGWRGSLNIGYMFHTNIGLEFQFNYIQGNDILMSRFESPTYTATHHLASYRMELVPQLVLNHQAGRWGIYSKTGVILPFWGYVQSDISIEDTEGRVLEQLIGLQMPGVETKVTASARTNPKFSYGFQARLGLSFMVNDWFDVFAEASFGAMSIRAKESIMESFNADLNNPQAGTNLNLTEADIAIYDLNSNYEDELTENSNNTDYNPDTDTNQAIDEPAFKDNFNHVGFNIGLRFRLF